MVAADTDTSSIGNTEQFFTGVKMFFGAFFIVFFLFLGAYCIGAFCFGGVCPRWRFDWGDYCPVTFDRSFLSGALT